MVAELAPDRCNLGGGGSAQDVVVQPGPGLQGDRWLHVQSQAHTRQRAPPHQDNPFVLLQQRCLFIDPSLGSTIQLDR